MEPSVCDLTIPTRVDDLEPRCASDDVHLSICPGVVIRMVPVIRYDVGHSQDGTHNPHHGHRQQNLQRCVNESMNPNRSHDQPVSDVILSGPVTAKLEFRAVQYSQNSEFVNCYRKTVLFKQNVRLTIGPDATKSDKSKHE